jgi:hypothetical protein
LTYPLKDRVSRQCVGLPDRGQYACQTAKPPRGLLGSGRQVTESTVKISAVLGFDSLKTNRNAVRSHNPRLVIGRRKFGIAGLAALRAPQIFNPMIACGHPLGMTQIPKRSYVV